MAAPRQTLDNMGTANPPDTENLPSLISRLGDDVMHLFDTKISLLKVELK